MPIRQHRLRPFALTWIIVALALAACGPSARDKTLTVTLHTVNAAADGFAAWHLTHGLEIVAKAKADGVSREQAEARVAEFDHGAQRILDTFAVVYRAIAVAAVDRNTPLTTVLATVEGLIESITAFKGGDAEAPPPPSSTDGGPQ